MRRLLVAFALFCLVLPARPAAGQGNDRPFEAGAQVIFNASGEFNTTEVGVGGRFAWSATPLLGAEAEMSFFPEDLDAGGPAFSAGRVEGLFGVTVGPVIGRIRPFGKARPGFVTFREAPAPFACILIFPPPLPCALGAGDTLFAFDVGGGVEIFPADRTFIRLDLGDRLVRYHGPVIDADGDVRDNAFFGHDFRFSIGGGVRF